MGWTSDEPDESADQRPAPQEGSETPPVDAEGAAWTAPSAAGGPAAPEATPSEPRRVVTGPGSMVFGGRMVERSAVRRRPGLVAAGARSPAGTPEPRAAQGPGRRHCPGARRSRDRRRRRQRAGPAHDDARLLS